jgi:hypothetical protein
MDLKVVLWISYNSQIGFGILQCKMVYCGQLTTQLFPNVDEQLHSQDRAGAKIGLDVYVTQRKSQHYLYAIGPF